MKIDHRKTNRSIDTNRYQLVNWYWLVLVNRWSIDSHIKLSANYIDLHRLAMLVWLLFCLKVTESSFIDCSSISNINRLIVIDWYRMASILIDWQFHWLRTPGYVTRKHKQSEKPKGKQRCNALPFFINKPLNCSENSHKISKGFIIH